MAPGAVVSEIARRHGMSPQHLFTWRREARRQAEAEASFAPVVVSDPAQPANRPAAEGMIEIAVSGAVIRVPAGADARTLTIVLRAMTSLR